MSDIIDSAPFAATLDLKTPGESQIFAMRDNPDTPAIVTVPGSSKFNLTLFNVTATGSVKAEVPGTLILTLYGSAKPTSNNPNWLPIASCDPEPIGGASDLSETMWMIEGSDLMIFVDSGKMQGTFRSNVASSPKAPIDLTQHPGDIEDTDPLYVFAVGASFTPTASRGAGRAAAEDDPTLCSCEMVNFTVNA